MKEIKYRYCLNKESRELVCINDLNQDNRYECTYECLECGQEMETNMGTKKRWYFSHKSGTACDGESYLHKLAKIRIRQKFESSDSFPIIFKRDIPCSEINQCMFKDDYYCKFYDHEIRIDLKKWKGKTLYDRCQEEKWTDGFRPDLKLTCKEVADRTPIFIEIFKTHESSDDKVNSGYKIIETFPLKSEADIDDIINRGFVENENCKMISFEPKIKSIRKADVSITRVVIKNNGVASFLSHGKVNCGMLNIKHDPHSALELNVLSLSQLAGLNMQIKLTPMQIGLAYAVKNGMAIRNCMLCSSYRFNDCYGMYICIKYKKLGEQCRIPKQYYAEKCNEYYYSPYIAKFSLDDLHKLASEVAE